MNLRNWLKNTGLSAPESNEELIAMPEVIDKVQKVLDKYNPLFSHTEQIKRFVLLPNEWTIDTGELTPSLKIKRKVIERKYEEQVRMIYGSSGY